MMRQRCCHTDCGVVNDKQHIGILRHSVEHRCELGELHLEGVEFLAHARTRVLQRLYNLARALVTRRAEVEALGAVGG